MFWEPTFTELRVTAPKSQQNNPNPHVRRNPHNLSKQDDSPQRNQTKWKTKNKKQNKMMSQVMMWRLTALFIHCSASLGGEHDLLSAQRGNSINICTIFTKGILWLHIKSVESVVGKEFKFHSRWNPSAKGSARSLLVKSLVSFLSLLEDYGSHHGADYNSQQGTEQKQEDLPASESRASEVSGGVVNVVWKRAAQHTRMIKCSLNW